MPIPRATAGANTATSSSSRCPTCGGAGWLRLEVDLDDPRFGQTVPCACKAREIEEKKMRGLLERSNLQALQDKTFATLRPQGEHQQNVFDRARELYQKALSLEPDLIDAAANLGVIEANQGRLREPLRLWQSAFERAPARSAIGMNIARVLCGAGEFDRARSSVLRVLEFNPDMAAAKEMLQHLNRIPPMCEQ